jgi:hypothetical protein
MFDDACAARHFQFVLIVVSIPNPLCIAVNDDTCIIFWIPGFQTMTTSTVQTELTQWIRKTARSCNGRKNRNSSRLVPTIAKKESRS